MLRSLSHYLQSLWKLLWAYCPGHARVKGNDSAQDWWAKQPSQVACISEDLSVEEPETLPTGTKPLKLLWVYCPGHIRVKGNVWADRLAGKATLTSDLLLRGSEVSRSLKHKAKAITPSISLRIEVWKEEALDDLPWKDKRGPSSVRQNYIPKLSGTIFSFRNGVKLLEVGWV